MGLDRETAAEQLTRQFQTKNLLGFGCDQLTVAIESAGCLLQYAKETQRTALPHIRGIQLKKTVKTVWYWTLPVERTWKSPPICPVVVTIP